jgi:hypothetical protein
MTGAVVFTGPTLPAADAAALLDCTILPPARQGDLWRAVRAHRPIAIGIIDGVFLHEPAVWHREILWALHQGTHVFGAASMGALRAAELAAFGMRGVGRVFEAFRDGVWPGFADTFPGFTDAFEDDDEVAVIHAPPEMGAMALSDAMVDLRDTLLAAEAAGVLGRATRDRLAATLKQLPFPERSFAALARLAAPHTRFVAWLSHGKVACKRLDAIAMLREMAALLADRPAPFQPGFRFEHPQVWADFVAGEAAPTTAEEQLALDELRLRPDLLRNAERAALGRLCAVAAAPPPPDDAERAQFNAFRHARGLARRADLDGWLAANAASPAALARLLHDEAAIDAALADPPPGLAMALLDHLRLTGALADLLARARAKQAALAGLTPTPHEVQAALAWHANRQPHAGWVDSSSQQPALPNNSSLRHAIWREYMFCRSGNP